MNSLRVVTATIVAQIFFTLAYNSVAFAANDTSLAIIRQEFRSPASVAIQGPLTGSTGCDVNRRPATSAANETSPTCQLQVRDEKSGQNYQIQSNTWVADDARTLYQAGVRNVSVEGRVTGSDVLTADSIQKANN
jgi:hypothetical protein